MDHPLYPSPHAINGLLFVIYFKLIIKESNVYKHYGHNINLVRSNIFYAFHINP